MPVFKLNSIICDPSRFVWNAFKSNVVQFGVGAAMASEKLKVFALAGQSNIVGHANPHTMALYTIRGTSGILSLPKCFFKDNVLAVESYKDRVILP